ncbi:MAG: type VI secretion system tube protein Hcp [Phycisphaerae bacterium]|nr:type VI secretion system tube protein Hcp [Phycisphaerae bacterium]
MPTPINLYVAEFPGSSEKEDRADSSDVFEMEHYIHQPVREEDGMASGVRVHSAMRVVCQIDKATPGLHKACCTGQRLPEVKLEFWRIDPSSRAESRYYLITMRSARVVDVRPYFPMSFVPANESYRHMVQYSFVYEEIEWNWLPESVVEQDKWRAPSG